MRLFRRRVEENAVPLDMTPMIDCVFLLLIFFMLTSRFIPDEKELAALLPRTGPQNVASPPVISERVRVAITPAGAPVGAGDRELDAWAGRARQDGFGVAELRLGGGEPLRIDLNALSMPKGPELDTELERVHRHVAEHLAQVEQGALSRGAAPEVEIHCFSGLPWSFAVIVYDAVRGYEAEHFGGRNDHRALADARVVNFAPPRIRNISGLEDGKELGEILRLH